MMSKLKLTVNETERGCAACRKRRLTFWVTPSVGTTTAGRASPIWGRVRRGRRSTGYAERSGELTDAKEGLAGRRGRR